MGHPSISTAVMGRLSQSAPTDTMQLVLRIGVIGWEVLASDVLSRFRSFVDDLMFRESGFDVVRAPARCPAFGLFGSRPLFRFRALVRFRVDPPAAEG